MTALAWARQARSALQGLWSLVAEVDDIPFVDINDFNNHRGAVRHAVEALMQHLDDEADLRLLDQYWRTLRRAGGEMALHLAETPSRSRRNRIADAGHHWEKLDKAIRGLDRFLESFIRGASSALGARQPPKTITVRVVPPEPGLVPPALRQQGAERDEIA